MLTPYTSEAEVRSVLGVTPEELSDATLGLTLYERNLAYELENVDLALAADFATVIAITPQSALTTIQRQFRDAVTMFAPYAVAQQLASSLPLFAVKTVTDGKAEATRHSDSPFKDVLARVEFNYGRFRQNLIAVYAAFKGTSFIPDVLPGFLKAVKGVDPVTGV